MKIRQLLILAISSLATCGKDKVNSCLRLLHNNGSAWEGVSESSRLPGIPIQMAMCFNDAGTELTVIDSKDPQTITIPVKVNCTRALEFELEDQLPKGSIGHMKLSGLFKQNQTSMDFIGEKTLYNKSYTISGDMTATTNHSICGS